MRTPSASSTTSGWVRRSSARPICIAPPATASGSAASGSATPRSAATRSNASATGTLHAPVDLREAPAQLRVADHVRPELEEHRQPAVVTTAPPGGVGRDALEPRGRVTRQPLLHLCRRRVRPPFIDGEEEVLLGGEVGVDGALRVPRRRRDLVQRRGDGSRPRRSSGRRRRPGRRGSARAARRGSADALPYRRYSNTDGI